VAQLLGRDAAVVLDRVLVEAGLAAAAGPLAAAEAGGLVTRAARAGSAVQGGELGAASVDVLHDVQLTDARPVGRADRTRGGAQRPERGPVPGRRGAGHVGLLQGRLDAQL